MSIEHFDVVVIGAGLGGLSAAGHLAKAGKQVLVLEHHTVPGGYAHEFRRGHYRFEVALHAIDGVAPGGWAYPVLKDLEVLDQVKFTRLDPFYSARFPNHEVTAFANIYDYEAELIRNFPKEAQGIRDLIDAMRTVFTELRRFQADGELGQRPSRVQMLSVYPNMIQAMNQSWGEFMDQYVHEAQLQGVISTLWGYYGLPPSKLNAATFILPWVSYHLYGAYYPEGGSMAMSRAIEKTIKAYGGEIRYKQTVTGFEIEDGRIVSVTTNKGLTVSADIVISNANAHDTLLKFVGKEHLPAKYINKVEREKPAVATLAVYLGLDRDLIAEGWQHHELFMSDGYDIEADYAAMMRGEFEKAGMVITHYNHADPTCTPEGGSILVLLTLAPWDYADQWGTGGDLTNYSNNPRYLELKQDAAETLLDRAEKLLPGIRESIKYMEVGTPVTNVRYSLNTGGSIYGSEQTVENMYLGRLRETTPIDNLYMTGAWVDGGGMSAAMLSGRSVAGRVEAAMDGRQAEGLMTPEIDVPDTAVSSDPEPTPIRQLDSETMPTVLLSAVSSNRKVQLNQPTNAAVYVFHGQNTAKTAAQLNMAVRNQYPAADDPLIASIVNLDNVPKMFRRIATSAMQKSYEKASQALPAGEAPVDYVVILPDWDGSISKGLGFKDVDKQAGVVVVNQSGQIVTTDQSDDLVATVLNALKKLSSN